MNRISVSRLRLGIIAMLIVASLPLKGAEIIYTVTGTITNSRDTFPIFDVGRVMNGQPFILDMVFDDTKGNAVPLGGCKGSATGVTGFNQNSPGKALLSIGTKTFTFGTMKTRRADIWREIASNCSESRINVDVSDGNGPTGAIDIVNFRLKPTKGKTLTDNSDWRAPLDTSDIESWSPLSGFSISAVGDYMHTTLGQFNITHLTVTVSKKGVGF